MTVHNALTGHRNLEPVNSASRIKCQCCGKRATHLLMADGAAMGSTCELFGRRWVKDARNAFKSLQRIIAARSRA